jgi:8-oxo-dGTP diphosphatase
MHIEDIQKKEALIRRIYARVLKKASRRKTRAITVDALTAAEDVFPSIASAKILAQEIYRHFLTGAQPRGPARLRLRCPDQRTMRIFQKTIEGYLRHLTEDLGNGPFVTVDTIIETKNGIVLIRRSNPPFGWALPGGFLDKGESIEETAHREAKEETGLNVKNLKQMHTYSDPSRDPRFHTVTPVLVCQAQGTPRAASDAADVRIVTPKEWRRLPLAFDHRQVLEDYLAYKKSLL